MIPMKRRTIVGLVAISAVIVLSLLILPTQAAVVQGNAAYTNGPGYAHYEFRYERSLSCQMCPVGLSYWDYTLILGCAGPEVP